MQKNFSAKNFQGPPFGPQNFSGPPFLTRKIGVNPIENHIDSLFRGKISVFFSGPPFPGSKIFRVPPFCIRPPLTSVCERSLTRDNEIPDGFPWSELNPHLSLFCKFPFFVYFFKEQKLRICIKYVQIWLNAHPGEQVNPGLEWIVNKINDAWMNEPWSLNPGGGHSHDEPAACACQ